MGDEHWELTDMLVDAVLQLQVETKALKLLCGELLADNLRAREHLMRTAAMGIDDPVHPERGSPEEEAKLVREALATMLATALDSATAGAAARNALDAVARSSLRRGRSG